LRSEEAEMMEQPDAVELRRRRRILVGGCVCSVAFTAEGILLGVTDGGRLGYLVAAFFGVCAVGWAARLLTPPEDLLRLPASHFFWLAPDGAGVRAGGVQARTTEYLTPRKPSPPSETCGVWDPELDRNP
jgi:hypothetical protein